jgi:hypothetical protein
MTFNDLKDYFAHYCALHLDLLHTSESPSFFAVNNDKSVDELICTAKKPTIAILLTPEKKLFPVKGEEYIWDKLIFFFVLRKASRTTPDFITSAQNDCEVIGNDFFTRLVADRYTLITSFKQESFQMHPVGPLSDDFYGQCLMFSLEDDFNPAVDPTRWSA